MKNENKIIQNPADYDYLKASSAQDCTGLIPSGIVDETEIEINSVWNGDELIPVGCSGFYHEQRKKVFLTPDEISI